MRLLLLEALGALVLLLLIVWWTMFSGRDRGELKPTQVPEPEKSPEKAPAASDGRITDQIRQLDR